MIGGQPLGLCLALLTGGHITESKDAVWTEERVGGRKGERMKLGRSWVERGVFVEAEPACGALPGV